MKTLKILSFNLKTDTIFTKEANKLHKRIKYIKEMLNILDYDILGVQELPLNKYNDLSSYLNKYHAFGLARNDKSLNDELSAIFLLKDRFKIIKEDTFWLSNTPNNKGSKYKLSIFPRICTLALALDTHTNKYILFSNTHLDHLLSSTRKNQIKQLINIINEYKDNYNPLIFITGDFNTNINSSAIKYLLNSNLNIKSVYNKETFNTIHFFKGIINTNLEPRDHIFVDNRVNIIDYNIINKDIDGIYPSDHYPVIATINIGDNI